ncbi:MAG: aldehyde dehydrogenase family protein [Slackia sp.]
MADLETSVRAIALAARKASAVLARTTTDQRNAALLAMARALREHSAAIVEANAEDMRAGRAAGMSEGLLDRLELNEQRVEGMASALEDLASLSDPVGRVLEERTIEGGMLLQRISVPLGVVAMVYEARPNVTADAAGICLKAGNACVLRGGSQALHSNIALTKVLRDAVQKAGLPADSICSIETADRAATDVLMGLHGLVDVLIPRGGAGLIRHCVEHPRFPS